MRLEQNPPAFPVEIGFGLEPGEPHQTGETVAQFPGMTLRDWFAGQAIPAVIRQCAGDSAYRFGSKEQQFAHNAYAIADAMLSERNKAAVKPPLEAAAPDMLEALREARGLVMVSAHPSSGRVLEQVEAAIAAATGDV